MAAKYSISINFRGGIIPPGYLKEVLLLAKTARVEEVRFGLRQQLLLDIPADHYPGFSNACREKGISMSRKAEALPNIVSSYFTDAIFGTESWLKEGTYKDIFDFFDYEPRLKINICDKNQRSVLLYTGHLNWVSASAAQFWHLQIRFPRSRILYSWPELVYTNDIAALSKALEARICGDTALFSRPDETTGDRLFNILKEAGGFSYTGKAVDQEVALPKFALSYYEGFNQRGNSYWLGIYRRDERFPLAFLLEACEVCLDTRIGEIYATNWKSMIIKGIESSRRPLWDYILGKYRINVRHAANELNWQIEDSQEALMLKRIIIRHFDKEDVRTFGLCFAVQTRPPSHMFASIIIRGCTLTNASRLKYMERYDILYENNFNPNGAELILFREKVEKAHLGPYLVSLCKMFYERQSNEDLLTARQQQPVTAGDHDGANQEKYLYQCKTCFTIYDEGAGEEALDIPPATPFEQVPEDFCCPVCDASKGNFQKIKEQQLGFVE